MNDYDEDDHYYNDISEDDSIHDEDYGLLGKAFTIKSKLEEATIDIHQKIISKIHPQMLNSALFTICQPYPYKKIKYKRLITNTLMNTINNVNNEYEMNCRCSVIDSVSKNWILCTNINCTASYHEECPETVDQYCVKCTLNMQREDKRFNIYTNDNENILFKLSFNAIDLLQCILQFVSFLDYTNLKMTSKILYNRLICSKARFGLYSIDIGSSGLCNLITIIKAVRYWKNCIKHITIEIPSRQFINILTNIPKLKKLISIQIKGERKTNTNVMKFISNIKMYYHNNLEKIELNEIYIKYQDVISQEFWNILGIKTSHLIINDMNIINYDQYEDILNNIENIKNQVNPKHFNRIKILGLRNIKPHTMMYLILYFCQQNVQKLTIDFNPFFNQEPAQFIPRKIQYQFNNLKSIHIYSYCFYKKFYHLFKSCLNSLECIHIYDHNEDDFFDDSDGNVHHHETGYWFLENKKKTENKECLIHLLLTSAPKLQSIKIDIRLQSHVFDAFCRKIYENKNNIKEKLPEITLCVSQSLYSLNTPNVDCYKWIVDGVKLLNSCIWNIIIHFECMPELFYNFTQKLQDIIINEIKLNNNNNKQNYFIKFQYYKDDEIVPYTLLRVFRN